MPESKTTKLADLLEAMKTAITAIKFLTRNDPTAKELIGQLEAAYVKAGGEI